MEAQTENGLVGSGRGDGGMNLSAEWTCGLRGWRRWDEPICRAGTEAQTENGLVGSGRGDGGTSGESGVDLHALSPAK